MRYISMPIKQKFNIFEKIKDIHDFFRNTALGN